MDLDNSLYTWNNVLLWGIFAEHCKKAYHEKSNCKRFVHITIAFIEFWPIISQIISIFEWIIVNRFRINFYSIDCVNRQFKPSILSSFNSKNRNSSNFNKENLINWNQKQIKEYHEIAKTYSNCETLFTWSRWSDANLMPSMHGLTLISHYLITRHAFQKDSLIVCSTLAEFREKLNIIQTTQDDFRRAFIVPTHSTLWGQKKNGITAKRSEEFPQHIVTVVVERQGNELHIALLDPMIRSGNERINFNNIGLDLEENVPFTEQELVLSYILSSNLHAEITTLYHSKVLREISNGCWAFALKDAVAFLKLPSFFKDLKTEDIQSSKKIKNFILRGIEVLPVIFMKTAQLSDDQFEMYFKRYPDQDSQDIRKKIAKHRVEGRNQRIGHATVKWIEKLYPLSSIN